MGIKIKFEDAWNNENYIKIINKVLSQFKINREDGLQCARIGLFKAIRKFDSKKRVKFTSYLYNRIRWEVLNFINEDYKKIYKKLRRRNISPELIICKDDLKEIIENEHQRHIINLLPLSEQKLIRKRYYDNLTLQEIATENNYSIETARKNINKILCKMSEIEKKYG